MLGEPRRSEYLSMPETIPNIEEPISETVPRACHLLRPEVEFEVYSELLDKGICVLIPIRLCIRDSKGNILL